MVNLLIIFGVLVVVVIAAMAYYSSLSGDREKLLAPVATKLGFTFSPKGDGSIVKKYSNVSLFQTGEKAVESNVLKKVEGDVQTSIADISWFDAGSNANSLTATPSYIHTVVFLEVKGLDLPAFVCTPSGRMMRYEQKMDDVAGGEKFKGYEKCEFEAFSDFSKKCVMYSQKKTVMQNLFTKSGLLDICAKEENLNFEGNGSLMIVYRSRQQVDPANIEGLLEIAKKVCIRLKKATELKG